MNKKKKAILVILDGWAISSDPSRSAIDQANTKYIDLLFKNYPHSSLITYGKAVGLPEGQMGNSEVGHLNIGAGRVVYQELLRINKVIESGFLNRNPVLTQTFEYAKRNDKALHLIGLVSNGGVHSHIDHLKALCTYAEDFGLKKVFIHAFTDGRDTDPKSGIGFLTELEDHISTISAKIVSVIGRYYAMDRDNRWERIKLAYDMMVYGIGEASDDLLESVLNSYRSGVTDEFLKPKVINEMKSHYVIKENDAVICFNFRTDRCRQITKALTQQDMPEFDMKKMELHYTTMTNYDDTFRNVNVIFENEDLKNTLGEFISGYGLKQVRIAETEKYPHVTFFFSGGREEAFPGEKRILIPSPKVATYDLQPEMSAYEVTRNVIEELNKQEADFICLNYANMDMVAHTGVFPAGIKAVETVDICTEQVVDAALRNGYTAIVTSDHGNADCMKNEDGSPNTAHTKNPVPFFVIDKDSEYEVRDGKLADIAPTILKIMNLPCPPEMTGEVLIKENVVKS